MKDKENSKISAIILAAGASGRMKGINKIFEVIEGQSVILRSIKIFELCERINEIIIVTKEDFIEEIKEIIIHNEIKKSIKVVKGGNTRQESVLCGINETQEEKKYIIVHDGARPFVSDDLLNNLLDKAEIHEACIPIVPVVDTIKEIDNNLVVTTPNREKLFAAQTPQVFLSELLIKASKNAQSTGFIATDDASVVEEYGHEVYTVLGEQTNIKITNPIDIEIAKYIAKNKKDKEKL